MGWKSSVIEEAYYGPTYLVQRGPEGYTRRFEIHPEKHKREQNERARRSDTEKELRDFSKNFKLKTPIPEDLLPDLAGNPAKQTLVIGGQDKTSHTSHVPQEGTRTGGPGMLITELPSDLRAELILANPKLPLALFEAFDSTAMKDQKPGTIAALRETVDQGAQPKPKIVVKLPPAPPRPKPRIIVKLPPVPPVRLPPSDDLSSMPQKDPVQPTHPNKEMDIKRQTKEGSSVAAVRSTDQSVVRPNQRENRKLLPTSTFVDTESSAGTQKTTWTFPVSSTAPTSASNTSGSLKGPNANGKMAPDQTSGTRQPLPAIEEVSQLVPAENTWDSHSTITTDSVELSTEQKEDIIRRFTEAILRELPDQIGIYHDRQNSGISCRNRFQSLLKAYSTKVKDDTQQRPRKKAAKQIRILRREISERCEIALVGVGGHRRIYPDITKEVEKTHNPEKTWGEKVDDWNVAPLEDTVVSEMPFENVAKGFTDIHAAWKWMSLLLCPWMYHHPAVWPRSQT